MNWIKRYQLFLFDFDGLLVNTEILHYQAYVNMCAQRKFKLDWSFKRYSEAAHHSATGLRDSIYAEFPDLKRQEPNWQVLYEEKKNAFLELIKQGAIPLMPGVVDLLIALQNAHIKRCVVTHSPQNLVDLIREQNPILNTIPTWITREHYQQPKPDPECYIAAINKLAQPGDQVIGFEDSPRGLKALLETPAKAVLVCPSDSPYLESLIHPQLSYYPQFTAINEINAP